MMNYVMQVSDLFLARCSYIKILGPMDFTIIAEWEKQEIPLEIVLASIVEVCDKLNREGTKTQSIGDVQAAVEQNFKLWLETKYEESRVLVAPD
jgi:hypothetical protein